METSYTSCACNRLPHTVDWGKNGLICYAACAAVVIYDPLIGKIGRIIETLYEHKNRINSVRWIKPKYQRDESEILSGSLDGTAIIWSKMKDNSMRDHFNCTSVIHVGENVTIINALCLSDRIDFGVENSSKLLVCTASVTGQFKLWLRDTDTSVKCIQTLALGKRLPIEACLSHLPNTDDAILAVALDDSSIQLYVQNSSVENEIIFEKSQTLLGHEDWVRCIAFSENLGNSIFLSTGSQDTMIRLWKISKETNAPLGGELKQKNQAFVVKSVEYHITLESVLFGHEGWVYGVHWHPKQQSSNKESCQPMKLLSCSMDKSMIIWEPDTLTGIWSEKVRVGEVGGNSLGFYGCKFNGDGTSILAHGYQGSFHIWKYLNDLNTWMPTPVPGGHFSEVVDLCWDPKGRFLITASTDQTTRIHAPLKDGNKEYWHEIARPQVHGYDMNSLVMLTPYMFASGAEEKVVRIFVAPTTFKNQLGKLADAKDFENMTADSATVPALGLTNKATFSDEVENDQTLVTNLQNVDYTPPTEEDLMQNTLWPEQQKLYGHGYEIFSIAATHNGSYLATACKSTSPEHATIILWDTRKWIQLQKLPAHQLTVTQMEFSPNDKYLLSVSRDRRWALFEFRNSEYNLVAASLKKDVLHTRIIWCCTWTHDSKFFATGSRDGKIGVWCPENKEEMTNTIVPTTSFEAKDSSVTALTFAPYNVLKDSYVLAVGYEKGHIDIQRLWIENGNVRWQKYHCLDSTAAHHLTVRRLKFRPQTDRTKEYLQLASCGSDYMVKIHEILIELLTH